MVRPLSMWEERGVQFIFNAKVVDLGFCHVVLPIEYSVRSAQTAVYSLLGIDRVIPPVLKGSHDPRILLSAFEALHAIST